MARSVDEWVGRSDDELPPPRVRLRIFDTHGGKCSICGRKICAGEYWQQGHIIALCNGGANREKNMAPECRNCCYGKTAQDVAEKSLIARKRSKHLSISKPKGFRRPPGMKFNWQSKRYEKVQ